MPSGRGKLGDDFIVRVPGRKKAAAPVADSRRRGPYPVDEDEIRPPKRSIPVLIYYNNLGVLHTIKNPASPVLKDSTYDITGNFNIEVDEGGANKYLFQYNGSDLKIWNVKKATTPTLLSTLSTTGNGVLYRDNNRLYSVRQASDSFQFFDIADKEAPSLLATVNVNSGAFGTNQQDPHAMAASGDYAYVTNVDVTAPIAIARTGDRLCTYNVSNPASVTQVNVITLVAPGLSFGFSANGIHNRIYNGHLYLTFQNDVKIYSLSNPAAPSLVNTLTDVGDDSSRAIDISNGKMYLITSHSANTIFNLKIYDLASPASPSLLHTFQIRAQAPARGLDVADGFAYVVISQSGQRGVQIVDARENPVEAYFISDNNGTISGIWAQAK